MSLNLDPIRDMVERDFLDDLVEVRSPRALPHGNLVATLNPDTLALTPPPLPAPLWSGAASLIAVLGSTRSAPMIADEDIPVPDEAKYKVLLPLDAPLFEKDQVLRVTGSRRPAGPRDPQIIGQEFRLLEIPPVHTYAVVRIAFLGGL